MRDVHEIFPVFKAEHPDIYAKIEELGATIHQKGGPLDERERALIKVAMSAASRHQRSLETHLEAASEANVTSEEIEHVLLMLINTCGFPTFMEAYSTYKAK
jgi:4-carboxymuconolactone decarboxylase